MRGLRLYYLMVIGVAVFTGLPAAATGIEDHTPVTNSNATSTPSPALYRLGPGDEISVQQANAEELSGKPARVDDMGFVALPLIGRIHVGGLTVQQSQSLIASRLSDLLVNPDPVVSIMAYRSQPVSVVGAVKNPGVIQLEGNKTLLEVISQAGGLTPDAGTEVEVTRQMEFGRIPAGADTLDPGGQYNTARINLTNVTNGRDPRGNIAIYPHDVISIPRAEMIYVTGNVKKAGGFPLNTNSGISVLQAVSLAEGLAPQSAPKKAKIFRPQGDGKAKQEVPVNVEAILSGKSTDFNLQPGDILFIPDSASKKAGVRAAEAAVEAATGVVIWGRY